MASRNRNKTIEWESTIDEQESSGLSIAEYCRTHEISRYQFTYWKRMLRSTPQPGASSSVVGASQFIEVKHRSTISGSHARTEPHVEINIGAFSIRFTDTTRPDLFRTAVAILGEIAK